MADRLPRPLLAALGLLADVRRLPARAMSVSVTLLAVADQVKREYEQLAARGEEVVAGVFGGGETAEESFEIPAPPPPPEADVVLDAIAHVEDPLERPRSLPEPITGYDGMTLGSLRGKLRSLSTADLEAILRYEKTHLSRQPMITLVEHRLAKLALA